MRFVVTTTWSGCGRSVALGFRYGDGGSIAGLNNVRVKKPTDFGEANQDDWSSYVLLNDHIPDLEGEVAECMSYPVTFLRHGSVGVVLHVFQWNDDDDVASTRSDAALFVLTADGIWDNVGSGGGTWPLSELRPPTFEELGFVDYVTLGSCDIGHDGSVYSFDYGVTANTERGHMYLKEQRPNFVRSGSTQGAFISNFRSSSGSYSVY